MFLRFVSNGYQLISRRLIWNSLKVSPIYIKQIKRQPLLLFTSALASATSVLLTRPAILCEDIKMSEIEQADKLYNENKFKELHEYLVQFKGSEDPEILWRIVRAHRNRATMANVSKDEKKKLIFDALEVSKRGLEFGEDNYCCHKWYGIMLSETGDYNGTKKKIEDSPAMKKHFEKAIELCPTDATSHYLVGMWCFSFADLAWYERKIAAVVFGSPPESSYAEALTNFEKAEKFNPGFYSANQYMIGMVNLKMGNKDVAKEWFQKVLQYNVETDEDKEFVKKAKDLLKSL